MKIKNVICSAGRTGFFFDDQKAIKSKAVADGSAYFGEPVTENFTSIRQAGESISVVLELENGLLAHGDCAAVQYSGTGGRDPLFLANDYIPRIMEQIAPLLIGQESDSFKRLSSIVDNLTDKVTGKRMHTAIRYGVTQALLDAVAKAKNVLMTEIVSLEYNIKSANYDDIRIIAQTGDSRYDNADKMIIKSIPTIPHGLINNVKTKLGEKGEKLLEYTKWLRDRVIALRTGSYSPNLHIDVYGTIGVAFDYNYEAIVNYLSELAEAAKPFNLYIEGPVDVGERQGQIEALAKICKMLKEKNIPVKIVADEWCNTYEDIVDFADAHAGDMIQIKTPDLGGINNTIEAVLYCKNIGIEAYQGGTCNETNRSAEVCVHMAMATRPDLILAKPGMGVDEGFMIVFNEMQRIKAILKSKSKKA